MNTLIGYDLVPEPKILDSALRACRRLNDLASAIRILEAVKVSFTPAFGSVKSSVLWLNFSFCAAKPKLNQRDKQKANIPACIHWNLPVQVAINSHSLQDKAGPHKDIYPYVIQELKPTLTELGISTPEELGIDKL